MTTSSYGFHNNNSNANGHTIDSLSASSLFSHYNANIDLTLKISDLYQLAIKNYLNKSFNKSWDLVIEILNKPISNIDDELSIKVYKLYLSLYDLMLKKEFAIDNIKELTENFHKGQLYTKLCESNIDDAELFLIVFIIEKANELDLQMLSSQLEQFLETKADVNNNDDQFQLKIIKFYLFSVLPYLDQYDKAESFIMKQFFMEDDKVKVEYMDRLKLIREDIQLQKKKQEEADLNKLKSQQQKKRTSSSSSSLQSVKPVPVAVANDNDAITLKPQHRTSNQNMIRKFTKMFEKFYKQNNSILMLLLLIIGLLLSFRKNKNLLVNTLKMIFKVSYV